VLRQNSFTTRKQRNKYADASTSLAAKNCLFHDVSRLVSFLSGFVMMLGSGRSQLTAGTEAWKKRLFCRQSNRHLKESFWLGRSM